MQERQRLARHAGAYRPVVLVIGLLAALMAALPSVAPDRSVAVGAGGFVASGDVPGSASNGAGPQVPGADGTGPLPSIIPGAQAVEGETSTGARGAAPSAPAAAAGDTSHCKNGRQFDVLLLNPPCYPKFVGDNGGDTAVGVTGDTVRVMWFELQRNPQVNAVLSTQGLAEDPAVVDDYYAKIVRFLNENYEFYGRRIEFIRFRSSCPETPTDVPRCIEEARRAMAMKPFIVFEASPLYPAVHDEFARAGFITLGGWHFDDTYFTGRRPYRYDVFMSGTDTVEFLAEFYCKNLAGRGATHSGRVIHPSIGPRGAPRKVGFLVQDDDARIRAARHFVEVASRCNGDDADPVMVKYSTDIERVQENADGLTVKLIDEGVTTVICSCDTIAPSFLLPAFTAASYFPEHLLPGSGLTDDDAIGRIFDPAQWAHAFGPSHLGTLGSPTDFDHSRAYRAGGGQGDACSLCRVFWWYMADIADMIQAAGPRLDAASVEAGTLALPDNGADSVRVPLYRFGSGDYTAWSDIRVVYWDPSGRSAFMNSNGGAYVDVTGRRFEMGKIPGGLLDRIPPAAS